MKTLCRLVTATFLAGVFLLVAPLAAQEERLYWDDGGHPDYRLYAPAWIWQGVPLSIVIVVKNSEDTRVTREVTLEIDENASTLFELPDRKTLCRIVEIPPQGETQLVFNGIVAKTGKPSTHNAFGLSIDGKRLDSVVFRTVRGPAFISERAGRVALAIITTAWCILCGVVVFRFAPKGGWRLANEATIPSESPDWSR